MSLKVHPAHHFVLLMQNKPCTFFEILHAQNLIHIITRWMVYSGVFINFILLRFSLSIATEI